MAFKYGPGLALVSPHPCPDPGRGHHFFSILVLTRSLDSSTRSPGWDRLPMSSLAAHLHQHKCLAAFVRSLDILDGVVWCGVVWCGVVWCM